MTPFELFVDKMADIWLSIDRNGIAVMDSAFNVLTGKGIHADVAGFVVCMSALILLVMVIKKMFKIAATALAVVILVTALSDTHLISEIFNENFRNSLKEIQYEIAEPDTNGG